MIVVSVGCWKQFLKFVDESEYMMVCSSNLLSIELGKYLFC